MPSPFKKLVYPLPRDGGLGIHATLDLKGMTKFGPDSEWLLPKKYDSANNDVNNHHYNNSNNNSAPSSTPSNKITVESESTEEVVVENPNSIYEFKSTYHQPLQDEDFIVDPLRASYFYKEIRRYWPNLPDNSLIPAYSGIRPKLIGPYPNYNNNITSSNSSSNNRDGNEYTTTDFLIQGPDSHGIKGIYNLYGIESPGLTASLAIGDHITNMIRSDFE